MGNLPSGTVTFLFTDIEGSTKLAQSLGDRWETIRARHHKILKSAIESNNGYVFQIIGDAFCAAFHNAGDALQASTQAQTNLQNEKWGDVSVKVRMGVHTGKAEVQEDGQYKGYLALSLVQRIMSAGHGNQTLLSGATENLLRGQLSEDIDLLDMGRHNFKGVPQAVRIFQVNAPGLQRDFPPLHTFDILPNNLPTQLTSFVGREKELADIKRLLSDTHMLTLIGPGGTGKTRLSIQVAKDVLTQYPDGIWLVDLAPILDPLLVPRTTAITIGLKHEPQRPVIEMLCDYLSKKKMLLILDNCEHLVDACARMADRILHAASNVQILASSREALGIPGEVTYRVPSLELPDVDNLPSLETLSQYEAVKLFIDRATATIPDFKVTNENAPALAQICHRLDGIPLAIELAAVKIRVLGVEQIAERLDDRFKLLTGGSRTAMERHQTLRATVDWSYNLLPPKEQLLFRRLAVFRGGWALEAAESICGYDVLDLLEQLINKSLVIAENEGGISRYRMLETIRQYANEKLVDSGESKVMREKHLGFFLNLAETAEPHLIRHEQLEWLPKLDADYQNLRSALELAMSLEKVEWELRLCAALLWYWEIRGYWQEGLEWVKKALALPFSEDDKKVAIARVKGLYTCAQIEWQLGNMEDMQPLAEEGFSLAIKVSGKKDIAIAKYYESAALMISGKDSDRGLKLAEQSFADFQDLGEQFWATRTYYVLDSIKRRQDRSNMTGRALKLVELARKAGNRMELADALWVYANSLVVIGQTDEATECLEESDRLYKQLGAESNSANLTLYAEIALQEGKNEKAKFLLKEMQERLKLLGEKSYREECSTKLGRLAMEEGKLEEAQEYFEESLLLANEIGYLPNIAVCLANQGNLFQLQGNTYAFKENARKSLSIRDRSSFNIYGKTRTLSALLYTLSTLELESSALILGALYNFQSEDGEPLLPDVKQYYYRAEANLREALDGEVFDSAFAEGQKMSLDDALDLVLRYLEKDE